jgi:micrococcal nuclease
MRELCLVRDSFFRHEESQIMKGFLMRYLFLSALLVFYCTSPAAAEVQWRVARVFDGDTVGLSAPNMPWVTVRLAYIDAPEKEQPHGAAARAAIEDMLKDCDDISFTPVDGDKYGRTVALLKACGRDINAAMLTGGHAWVFVRYNKDPAFPALEEAARDAKRGLWGEKGARPPWEWREQHPKNH